MKNFAGINFRGEPLSKDFQSLTSELKASNQHFSLPALPIGTNLIPIYKILLQLKFLNEHYLVLFVLSQRGLKLLTRLRLGLSHLREHKFRHNFNDTIDPFCLCGTNNLETSEHFLLHCPTYACLRRKLFDNLHNNNVLLLPLEKSLIVQILLYGSDNYHTSSINKIIISAVIDFIIQSKRFDDPLIK